MTQTLSEAIARFSPVLPLVVAFSGGADSTALLLACHQRWPGQVGAIHIHHGLQVAADGFQRHCEQVCAQLKVPLVVSRITAFASAGQSPEDAARIARYRAFADLALTAWPVVKVAESVSGQQPTRTLALAQHADDQVETVLLALSRGAGLAGLSAMPKQWQRDGIAFHRPLLNVSARDVRSWVALQDIAFVEDPSNTDLRFTRNQIRARIIAPLESVFPHIRDTIARSAAHAAQAQELLLELGQDDWVRLRDADSESLALERLRELSRARQANALRYWLKVRLSTQGSTAQLNELLDQVAACKTRGHKIHIKVGSGFATRQGDYLTWYNSR